MYKGGIKILLLLAIIAIIMVSASFIGFDTNTLTKDVQEKAAEIVTENNQKIVDKVVEEGRTVVGEKLKETGEKMLIQEGNPGVFQSYDESLIGTHPYTIIFFTAPWCPSCVAAENDIMHYKEVIPTDLIIMKADFDDGSLREKYNVENQHTLILIDASGAEKKRWTNSTTLQEIITHITE